MVWQCSNCNNRFNWVIKYEGEQNYTAQFKCPYCQFITTVITGGTQSTSDKRKLLKEVIKNIADQRDIPGEFREPLVNDFWNLL
jgi:DNA-directed RNA polymerase subunit RPC12/RpoP